MLPPGAAAMRVLIVEDQVKMAGLIRRGLRKEGMAVDVAGDGEEALSDGRGDRVRRDHPRRDAARASTASRSAARLRANGVWAPILMLTARDAVRDRVAGPRQRRRRLPDQAVLLRGAAGAPARPGAPRRRWSAQPSSRSATSAWTRRERRVWRGDTEIAALAEGVLAPRDLHAAPRRGALALPAARARLGLRLREPLQRRRLLHPPPARQDRPAVRRRRASRRCAAPATACERTAAA